MFITYVLMNALLINGTNKFIGVKIVACVCVIFHQLRKLAGGGLIALLIAVYPANIHMAVNYHLFPDISQTMLYFRLLLQFLFAYWVYRTTISKNLQVTH